MFKDKNLLTLVFVPIDWESTMMSAQVVMSVLTNIVKILGCWLSDMTFNDYGSKSSLLEYFEQNT
jgi:uncharacterized Fe-S radical SAM superfamily protein PflX